MEPSIGIVEWRDQHRNSYYPLQADVGIPNLFVDASFVQFDNFIPKLNRLEVTNEGVLLEFQFDNNTFLYLQKDADCYEGAIITLRDSEIERYYGRIICGPGILEAVNNFRGQVLKPEVAFSPLTVHSIPSAAGLYSLENTYGNIQLKVDKSQFFTIIGNNVKWNAVAMPSNIPEVTLKAENIYALTNRRHIVEINLAERTMVPLFTLSSSYQAIATVNGKLIGIKGTDVYDLSALPPTHLGTLEADILALTADINGKELFGITSDSLLAINPTTAASQSLASSNFGKTLSCYYGNTDFIFTVPGPFDKAVSHSTSDLVYKINPGTAATLAGLITINGNMHQPTCVGLVHMPDDGTTYVHALLADEDLIKVIKVNLLTGVGEFLFSISTNTSIGLPVAVTDGKNTRIILRRIVGLKHINGVGPINNAIQFSHNGLIRIQKTNPDELTINLATEAENTIIKHSVQYE